MASMHYIKGRKCPNSTEQNFKTALSYLTKVRKEDFYQYERIKNMEIKIYYELGDLQGCLDTIDSFGKSFPKNEQIPDNVKNRQSNFVKFASRLAKLKDKLTKMDNDKKCKEKEELREEILACQDVDFRGWLLEKLEEI